MTRLSIPIYANIVCSLLHVALAITYLKTSIASSTDNYRSYEFVDAFSTYTDENRASSLLTTNSSSALDCASLCLRYRECYTYQFDRTNGICYLINDVCRTSDEDRFNCGLLGVSESDCRAIGCCYNKDRGVCFRSIPCNRPMNTPEDCGWRGITSEQCHAKGCCENSYNNLGSIVHGNHWCIQPSY